MRTQAHSTVALMLVLMGASALAQTPVPTRQSGGARALRQQLQLTDDQVTQIREIRRQQAESLRPQREQVRTAARSLKDMTDAANPDPAAVGKQFLALKGLRSQLRDAQKDWNQKAMAVLTPDQQAKLKEMRANRQGARRFRGGRAFDQRQE